MRARILEPLESPRRHGWGIVAGAFIVLFLIIIILLLVLPSITIFTNVLHLNGNYTSTYAINTGSNNPSIYNSTVEITYPSNYDVLRNYSLALINVDRANADLSSVTISPIQSGQQHADSMLYFGYFSHWDTQGLKPYMRYTILNGTGFVEENVAYEYTSHPSYLTTSDVEKAISTLEYQMVYNDSACCQNGHRDNILTPLHNRVSIGIAYDSTHVYFVEDFETDYISFGSQLVQSGNQVNLIGNTTQALNPNTIMIFYDNLPTSLNSSTLNTDYYGPYGQGNFVGGVLPPCNFLAGCSSYDGYITVYANTWQITSTSINIQFSLSKFIDQDGNGVYTLYMIQGNQTNPEYLTSISVFETG